VSEVRTIIVGDDDSELRLDRWFKRHFPALGHGRLEKLLRTGQIRIDGKRAKSGTRLASGQSVRVPPLRDSAEVPPRQAEVAETDLEALRASILYRDDWVIAIDKPAGLAVQGGTGQSRHLDAMLDGLRFDRPQRPKLVHRLDKDTSGVLLLARSDRAARVLAAAFREQDTRKLYWAIVPGVPRKRRGRIDLPLAKRAEGADEKVAGDVSAGKSAVTLYATAGVRGRKAAWLVLRPLTGRTHQLRVHCAALGHPILGDGKYGGRDAFPPGLPSVKRLHLHAREIALPHPDDGTTLRITAPLPADLVSTWRALGFDPAGGEDAAARLEQGDALARIDVAS
jgi:23S rRNA pseudouridine955/2504/2580 synthase